MIEKFTLELDVEGYKILQKLLEGVSVTPSEFEYVSKVGFGDFRVAVEDEKGTGGITLLGYAALVRYNRGQSNIRIT